MSKRSRRVTRQQSPEISETPTFNVQTLAAAINEVKNDLKSSQDALIERMKNEILAEVSNRLESIPANGSNQRLNTTVDVEQPMSQSNGGALHNSSQPLNDVNNTKTDPKMPKFSGNPENKLEIESFLTIFESLFETLTDEQKIKKMVAFLDGEAANAYAIEVLSNKVIVWNDAKDKLINRYAHTDVPPITAATRRRLLRNEDIRRYFDDKVKLLRKTALKESEMAELLTEGLPDAYRPFFYGKRFPNVSEWLKTAQDIEADRNRQNVIESRKPEQLSYASIVKGDRQTYANATRNSNRRPTSRNDAPPPYACRHCRRNGVTGEAAMHWERQCPNSTRPKTRAFHAHFNECENSEEDGSYGCEGNPPETLNSAGGQQN